MSPARRAGETSRRLATVCEVLGTPLLVLLFLSVVTGLVVSHALLLSPLALPRSIGSPDTLIFASFALRLSPASALLSCLETAISGVIHPSWSLNSSFPSLIQCHRYLWLEKIPLIKVIKSPSPMCPHLFAPVFCFGSFHVS